MTILQIHQSGFAAVLATTGGGASAVARLLEVPGASRSVLEALVPYSNAALEDLLRAKPEQFCSQRTARAMAMVAFERARRWASSSSDPLDVSRLVGVACTASLASDRPKRGAHRAHVALQTDRLTRTYELQLASGLRSRRDEEQLVGELILQAFAGLVGVAHSLSLDGLQPDESCRESTVAASDDWRALLLGKKQRVLFGQRPTSGSSTRRNAIFPGAFNPLHEGHQRMAAWVEQRYDASVFFELSIENVDKPLLDFAELAARGANFGDPSRLWLTRAPTFLEKARLFPQSLFVVGADTVERIANPKYYGGSEEACRAAIAEIGQRGCRFVVFGRQSAAGFQTLQTLVLPERLRDLCDYVPESEFRADVSSTEIRRRAAAT
ncbi:MAG: CinA family protein [Pirellulales bacterium]